MFRTALEGRAMMPKPAATTATGAAADFAELDACHQQIHAHLDRLVVLANRVQAEGLTPEVRAEAGAIESFFSRTSRDHHAQEERTVIPTLLQSGDAELVAKARTIQQDHGWIEENWIELAPRLRALAEGTDWVDPAEFQHDVQVYDELCGGHIALEESLIYPEARARWAERLARSRERA